ncbi:MAG TPA: serine protein kinase RIO, partial [Trueperaceae bacterium]|nr:serine protein kinase RIO [Trueperaceae bacterium]
VLKLGKVHGDFSTYNLLWWKDQAILIDFPQVVNISENKHAKEILKTDLNSLAKSFQVLGIDKDPKQLYKELIKELGPLF